MEEHMPDGISEQLYRPNTVSHRILLLEKRVWYKTVWKVLLQQVMGLK